jgi:hypothetical protein
MPTRKSSAPTAPAPAAAPNTAPAAERAAPSAAARRLKPAARPATQAEARVAAKPAVATPPAKASKPVKPPKAGKADKSVKAAKPPKLRQKPVRDSFTMPEADFAQIATLKARLLAVQRETKKSELLRTGLHALAALDTPALLAAVEQLEPVKIGRPKQGL